MSSVQRLPIIPRIIFDLQSDSSDEDFWKKVYFCNIIMFHTKLLCNSMYPLKTFNFSLYHICRTLQTQPHVISTCLDDSKSHWEEELSGPIKKKKEQQVVLEWLHMPPRDFCFLQVSKHCIGPVRRIDVVIIAITPSPRPHPRSEICVGTIVYLCTNGVIVWFYEDCALYIFTYEKRCYKNVIFVLNALVCSLVVLSDVVFMTWS